MNRRTIPTALLAACLLAAAARGQTPVSLDVKTKWNEKPALGAIKNGAELFLLQSDWAAIVELGEDYTLWIRNLGRRRTGDSTTVTIGVELRTPSMFEPGELIAKRVLTTTYAAGDDWSTQGTPEAVSVIREIEKYVDVAVIVARLAKPGAMLVVEKTWSMLQSVMPDEFLHVKLEAMVIGLKVAAAARDLIDEARGTAPASQPTTSSSRKSAPAGTAKKGSERPSDVARKQTEAPVPAAPKASVPADTSRSADTAQPAPAESAEGTNPDGTTTSAAVPGGE